MCRPDHLQSSEMQELPCFLQQKKQVTEKWSSKYSFFDPFFFSWNIVVLSAMVHATWKRKLCPLPSWKAEADGNKKAGLPRWRRWNPSLWRSFFWKAFWKDMDGFFPTCKGKKYRGFKIQPALETNMTNKTSNKLFWRQTYAFISGISGFSMGAYQILVSHPGWSKPHFQPGRDIIMSK